MLTLRHVTRQNGPLRSLCGVTSREYVVGFPVCTLDLLQLPSGIAGIAYRVSNSLLS